MPRLIWSLAALNDIKRRYRFLDAKNPETARRAVIAIRTGVKPIAYQPGIGRPVEGMEPEYREWLIDFGDSGYIVLYRHGAQAAVILAVRHQREVGY